MRVAVVSNDEQTVSRHFGRAPYYVVFTVTEGEIAARETRPKAGHATFASAGVTSDVKHVAMMDAVRDCDAVVAGGMGDGAMAAFRAGGIEAVVTDESDAPRAALRYARGDLPNLTERIHRGRGRH